jgi:hypothetical protein
VKDAQVLSALIPAAAGLLGALIGFAGSQLTHKRTADLAREQRRFERAQEMRAEVIPRLFVWLGNLEKHFDWILDLPLRGLEKLGELGEGFFEGRFSEEQTVAQTGEWLQALNKRKDAFRKEMDDLNEYFELHRIWLPQDLGSTWAELVKEYNEHRDNWERAFNEAWSESLLSELDDIEKMKAELTYARELYEAQVRSSRDWFEEARRRREAAMWSAARKVLAVED